jgi:hypothetical protein
MLVLHITTYIDMLSNLCTPPASPGNPTSLLHAIHMAWFSCPACFYLQLLRASDQFSFEKSSGSPFSCWVSCSHCGKEGASIWVRRRRRALHPRDILKVNESPLPSDLQAAYEELMLHPSPPPRRFADPDSPFSPPPPHPCDILMLFTEDENGALSIDLDAMVALYYPLVHPGIVEYHINAQTGLRTDHHTFLNMAILPDFILARPDCCRALDLLP